MGYEKTGPRQSRGPVLGLSKKWYNAGEAAGG